MRDTPLFHGEPEQRQDSGVVLRNDTKSEAEYGAGYGGEKSHPVLTSITTLCISFILGTFTKAYGLAGLCVTLALVVLGYILGNLFPAGPTGDG